MGLNYAIDELYATGWTALDSQGCQADDRGRLFPTADRVRAEFATEGLEITLEHVALFDCYKALWTRDREQLGSVVGHTRDEAAVFALARLRRSLLVAGV